MADWINEHPFLFEMLIIALIFISPFIYFYFELRKRLQVVLAYSSDGGD